MKRTPDAVAAKWLQHTTVVDSAAVSGRRVVTIPECVECGARWLPGDPERWQLRKVDLDEFAWYCAACVEREFGEV